VEAVSGHIAPKLPAPPCGIGRRPGTVLRASVPEAAVNKHDDFCATEHKVRSHRFRAGRYTAGVSRQCHPNGKMPSPSGDARSAHGAGESKLRGGVGPRPNAGHDG